MFLKKYNAIHEADRKRRKAILRNRTPETTEKPSKVRRLSKRKPMLQPIEVFPTIERKLTKREKFELGIFPQEELEKEGNDVPKGYGNALGFLKKKRDSMRL